METLKFDSVARLKDICDRDRARHDDRLVVGARVMVARYADEETRWHVEPFIGFVGTVVAALPYQGCGDSADDPMWSVDLDETTGRAGDLMVFWSEEMDVVADSVLPAPKFILIE